jgi:hypothetical protein
VAAHRFDCTEDHLWLHADYWELGKVAQRLRGYLVRKGRGQLASYYRKELLENLRTQKSHALTHRFCE